MSIHSTSLEAHSSKAIIMGVTKKMLLEGNGVDKAKKGDTITMEYTGNLYDPSAADGKGNQSVRALPRWRNSTR